MELNNVFDLPNDLWKCVFSFLDRKSWCTIFLTCKRFRNLGIEVFDVTPELRRACCSGDSNLLTFLLKFPKLDLHRNSGNILLWISMGQHKHLMDIIIREERVNKSAYNNLAIKWASSSGHTDIVEELLKDPSVDPSAEENYAVRWAAANGHLEVVKALIGHPKVDFHAGMRYAKIFGKKYVLEVLQQQMEY